MPAAPFSLHNNAPSFNIDLRWREKSQGYFNILIKGNWNIHVPASISLSLILTDFMKWQSDSTTSMHA
jgi:hypothetical protein